MTLLCFLLDLRSISPQLLRDLKQCLLQLANLYAISSNGAALQDLIGLCCIHRKRSAPAPAEASASPSCDELKIVYSPRGNFNLRDFHHAVNNLPTDSFLAEFCESGVPRSATGDAHVLGGLVKRWLQELKNEVEEPLQVFFLFKNCLVGSVNQIFCNLFATATHTIDGFSPCQTCRCHGLPVDGAVGYQKNVLVCPVTFHELGASDLVDNAMKVGKQTILFLPSFQSWPNCQQVPRLIAFNVIERTSLASLSEGVVMGTSFFVTPATYHDVESASDGYDKSELNSQQACWIRGDFSHSWSH